MDPVAIEVGQQWITRSGESVRVCHDRGETLWRWALTNSEMVNGQGRAHLLPHLDHPNDLIKLIQTPK